MISCPKCEADSGGGWSDCEGDCPMKESPHFSIATERLFSQRGLPTSFATNPPKAEEGRPS